MLIWGKIGKLLVQTFATLCNMGGPGPLMSFHSLEGLVLYVIVFHVSEYGKELSS